MPATAAHVLQPKGQVPAADCLHVVIGINMSLVQLIRVGDGVDADAAACDGRYRAAAGLLCVALCCQHELHSAGAALQPVVRSCGMLRLHPVTVSKGGRRARILQHLSCQAARIPARLPPMTTRGLGCSWVAHWLRAGEAVHMHASLQALVCACERAYAGQTTTGRREHRERSRHSESCRPSSLVRV